MSVTQYITADVRTTVNAEPCFPDWLDRLRELEDESWRWEVEEGLTGGGGGGGGVRGRSLVTAAGARGVVDPVEHDERQAANHEDDANHQENCRLGEKQTSKMQI